MSCFFFFQAEDGIRDVAVTGVQTCALPIFKRVPQHDQEDGHTGSECPRGWNHVRHCTRSVVRTLVPERFQFYETSRALTLISALNSFETGQPVSAFFTAVSNFAWSAPGMCATRSKWLFVMAKPSGSFSSEMVAVVSSLLAVIPAFPNCPESAMVKQPACAAASNSSGLVPVPFSNRALKEYGVCRSTPLSVETVPLPSFNPPCHTAEPLRCMFSSPLVSCDRLGS